MQTIPLVCTWPRRSTLRRTLDFCIVSRSRKVSINKSAWGNTPKYGNYVTAVSPHLPLYNILTWLLASFLCRQSSRLGSHPLKSLKEARQVRSAGIDHKTQRSGRSYGEQVRLSHLKKENAGPQVFVRRLLLPWAARLWPRPILGNQAETEARWRTGIGGQTWSWISTPGPDSVQLHFWKSSCGPKNPGVSLKRRQADVVLARAAYGASLPGSKSRLLPLQRL